MFGFKKKKTKQEPSDEMVFHVETMKDAMKGSRENKKIKTSSSKEKSFSFFNKSKKKKIDKKKIRTATKHKKTRLSPLLTDKVSAIPETKKIKTVAPKPIPVSPKPEPVAAADVKPETAVAPKTEIHKPPKLIKTVPKISKVSSPNKPEIKTDQDVSKTKVYDKKTGKIASTDHMGLKFIPYKEKQIPEPPVKKIEKRAFFEKLLSKSDNSQKEKSKTISTPKPETATQKPVKTVAPKPIPVSPKPEPVAAADTKPEPARPVIQPVAPKPEASITPLKSKEAKYDWKKDLVHEVDIPKELEKEPALPDLRIRDKTKSTIFKSEGDKTPTKKTPDEILHAPDSQLQQIQDQVPKATDEVSSTKHYSRQGPFQRLYTKTGTTTPQPPIKKLEKEPVKQKLPKETISPLKEPALIPTSKAEPPKPPIIKPKEPQFTKYDSVAPPDSTEPMLKHIVAPIKSVEPKPEPVAAADTKPEPARPAIQPVAPKPEAEKSTTPSVLPKTEPVAVTKSAESMSELKSSRPAVATPIPEPAPPKPETATQKPVKTVAPKPEAAVAPKTEILKSAPPASSKQPILEKKQPERPKGIPKMTFESIEELEQALKESEKISQEQQEVVSDKLPQTEQLTKQETPPPGPFFDQKGEFNNQISKKSRRFPKNILSTKLENYRSKLHEKKRQPQVDQDNWNEGVVVPAGRINKPLLIIAVVLIALTLGSGYYYFKYAIKGESIEEIPFITDSPISNPLDEIIPDKQDDKQQVSPSPILQSADSQQFNKDDMIASLKTYISDTKANPRQNVGLRNGFFLKPLDQNNNQIESVALLESMDIDLQEIHPYLDQESFLFVLRNRKKISTEPIVAKVNLLIKLKADVSQDQVIETIKSIEPVLPTELQVLFLDEEKPPVPQNIIFKSVFTKSKVAPQIRYFNFDEKITTKSIEWGIFTVNGNTYLSLSTSKHATDTMMLVFE
jgi:hypothetical protein